MATPAPIVVCALSQLPTMGGSDFMVGSCIVSEATLLEILSVEGIVIEGFGR